MNEVRKFLFGPVGTKRLRPVCQQCVQNVSKADGLGMSKLLSKEFSDQLRDAAKNVTQKLDLISEMLSKQCNAVLAQRIRRSYQMLLLYRNLYGERLLKEKVSTQINRIKKKPLIAVLSASIFNWDRERISDEEVKRCYKEVDEVHRLSVSAPVRKQGANKTVTNSQGMQWEQVVDKEDFKVWRHQLPNSELYQYRVLGHFKDLPARAFYNTQVDVHYWKDWDTQTMDVRVVDKDTPSGTEVIHWLYSFPYPMYPREYVYVRRCMVYPDKNCMIITARATKHPKCPTNKTSVRIETYKSQMIITPRNNNFDENGFTYVMSYYDDPQTNFPPVWYNWVAGAGVHEFLQRLHSAALKKHKNVRLTASTTDPNSSIYSVAGGFQDWKSIFKALFTSWRDN